MTDDEYIQRLNGIPAEIERERLRSRLKDRCSGRKIHPIQHDINMIVNLAIERRRRAEPAVLEAARRVLPPFGGVPPTSGERLEAIRFLVAVVLDGACGRVMRRRCERVIGYCTDIERFIALHATLKEALTAQEEIND